MSYLDMKYSLLLSYLQFLACYLLMKLEGREVEGHPIIARLVGLKTMMERCRALDGKLQY